MQFQFPPLREGRRTRDKAPPATHFYFNSRPCARGDMQKYHLEPIEIISIPAPARGATLSEVSYSVR